MASTQLINLTRYMASRDIVAQLVHAEGLMIGLQGLEAQNSARPGLDLVVEMCADTFDYVLGTLDHIVDAKNSYPDFETLVVSRSEVEPVAAKITALAELVEKETPIFTDEYRMQNGDVWRTTLKDITSLRETIMIRMPTQKARDFIAE